MAEEEYKDIEHRLDQLDAWHQSEDAVKRARDEVKNDRRFKMQVAFSTVSAVSMLINIYLSLFQRK